ncbi:MAG: hypothetical protein L0154_24630 [Chloroflexi bacterium]|nr:hypothetical protein [Chloroflexota bacterium]
MSVDDTILILLDIFIERQRLAEKALQELRPDIILKAKLSVENVELWEVIQVTKLYKYHLQRGEWEHEGRWQYFVHGTGIKLTNTVSGEPIEWDAPDPDVFDVYWFANWVEWKVLQSGEFRDLRNFAQKHFRTLSDVIMDRLKIMKNANVIAEIKWGKYLINKADG